ncbi:hypothetical protein JIN85_09195 [Luteolibacter pohnpeiensis]|uniref:YbgF trimerisation domain-containing protein n=1 Tax=Luteolibacter pohnpeiensis TaxID=454153 RepID=A0A934VVU6_9BACT|nr:hypothetical protein [Luteolibacter pohnpeiensis]MBK1882590.1 hypothetical protein [Luteolibacter pohnpeiensis]
MKSTTPPIVCSVALAAMAAAGTSHWWSVRQMLSNPLLSIQETPVTFPIPSVSNTVKAAASNATDSMSEAKHALPDDLTTTSSAQEKFYQNLVAELKELRTQNQDLRDQIAETNRDVMKLEFRVDTHSESFRPLPVSEDRFDTTFESNSGILPPRALPVDSTDHP